MTTDTIKAWEPQADGTLEPVTVTGRTLWPGALRIERQDGTTATANRWGLVSHETGERLSTAEVQAALGPR